MASIAFALCAAALYGSADFLGGLAARRSAVMPVMIFSQLAGSCICSLPYCRGCDKQSSASSGLLPLLSARLTALIVLAVVALSYRSPLRVGRDAAWFVVLAGALDISANLLDVLAARQGMLTIAATLTSLYPASTIVLGRFVLGERLRAIQIAGLSCARGRSRAHWRGVDSSACQDDVDQYRTRVALLVFDFSVSQSTTSKENVATN